MKNKKPLLIAHRGFSAAFPENTMAAFEAAIKNGAQMIECDLHLTRDAKVVVTHDYWLGRCIPGKGYIFMKTAAELKAVSNGEWFHSRFRDERVPLLSELLELCRGKIEINLEIKGKAQRTKKHQLAFASAVIQELKKFKMRDSVVISSFEAPILKAARSVDSKIRLGVLEDHPEKSLQVSLCKKLKAYSFHPNFKRMTREGCDLLHKNGVNILAYTLNSPQDFDLGIGLGLDGIITNEVKLLHQRLS